MTAMSATPPPPEPTEEDTRLTAYLYDLLEVGAKVAQSVGRQADCQAQPGTETPTVNVADQFECVSRAMRRTVLLIRHLAQPAAGHNRTQSRKGISRKVEDASPNEAKEPRDAEPPDSEPPDSELRDSELRAAELRDSELRDAEPRDRLDALDPPEAIPNRPVQDIIKGIRRDLGLERRQGNRPGQRRRPRNPKTRRGTTTPRPPDLHIHGPDPGAPQSHGPPRHPDRERQKMAQPARA